MSLHDAIQKLKFDTRMRSILVRQGQLTDAEIKQQAASLPDSASNAAPLDLESANDNDSLGGNGAYESHNH